MSLADIAWRYHHSSLDVALALVALAAIASTPVPARERSSGIFADPAAIGRRVLRSERPRSYDTVTDTGAGAGAGAALALQSRRLADRH